MRQKEAVKEQQVALKMDKDGEESVQVEIERMKIHKPKEPQANNLAGDVRTFMTMRMPCLPSNICYSCHSKG